MSDTAPATTDAAPPTGDARPRAVAGRLAGSAALLLLGLVLLVAAVHESLDAAVWAAVGGPPQVCDESGAVCTVNTDVSPWLVLGAAFTFLPGAVLLVLALLELGRRSDTAVNARPAAPLW